MLITPPSLQLDYALPACCQARLLSCNHRKLRAEAAAQTRKRCNQTIKTTNWDFATIVAARGWPVCHRIRQSLLNAHPVHLKSLSSSWLPTFSTPFWPTCITVRCIQIFALFSFFTFKSGAGSGRRLLCPSKSPPPSLCIPATRSQTGLWNLLQQILKEQIGFIVFLCLTIIN